MRVKVRSKVLRSVAAATALAVMVITVPASADADAEVKMTTESTSTVRTGPVRDLANGGLDRVAKVVIGGTDIDYPEHVFSACPELTDSLYRLYTAYFLRAPDADGFNFWLDQYSEGVRNLDLISRYFADNEEFSTRYGQLDDAAFVALVYNNLFDRDPDAEGARYWEGRLNSGMKRGTMMLFFSESEEYVTRTETSLPLSGYFSWYPRGVSFHCGWGSTTQIGAVRTNDDGSIFNTLGTGDALDVLVDNLSDSDTDITLLGLDADGTGTVWTYRTVSAGDYLGYFGGIIEAHEVSFEVSSLNDGLFWAVVQYSANNFHTDREGWVRDA